MPQGRKRLASALLGLALLGSVGVVGFAPAQAEPSIEDVEKRVDTLLHEAEQASERLNDTKLELEELRGELVSLRADQERQRAALEAVREDLQDAIVSQYQGQHLSAVGVIAETDDPGSFVATLSTMSAYNALQAQKFDSYATEAKALALRQKATARRAAALRAAEERLLAEKETIETKHAAAEELLERLKAEEREALLTRGAVRVPAGVDASGRAAIAIRYAMAQVGKRYSYGAAGPSAFDCSGLMMRAWAQAGISLPHSSKAQYGVGRHVSANELQPGDLVFYYSPISHVAMYIGNGLIVEAANPRAGVRVAGLYSMPYVGATRLI